MILLAGCTPNQSPQEQVISPISANLFYEYLDPSEYQTKNINIENGIISESADKWERGFAKAVPVGPAEELAKKLGFKDYTELQLAYGQLYHYNNYPMGKVYVFFGNYNATNDYTVMIWNDSDVQKIPLPDTDFYFRDLQYDGNHLYLILTEYPEEKDDLEDHIFVYEIDLKSFKPTKYTLSYKRDVNFSFQKFLIKNKKLYVVSNANITHTTADSYLMAIDLSTNKSSFIEKKGLFAVSLLEAEDVVAVIYGKIMEGFPDLPPYIEYYDEQLNIIDSKTLTINENNYYLYLGDFLVYDDNMYLVLKNKKSRDCLFVIHNMTRNERVYAVEIEPPIKGAIMQDTTFFINENGEYYTLP